VFHVVLVAAFVSRSVYLYLNAESVPHPFFSFADKAALTFIPRERSTESDLAVAIVILFRLFFFE